MVVRLCRAPTGVVEGKRQDLSEAYRETAASVDRMNIDGKVTLQFSQEFPIWWIITSNT
jgi:hypothetical protein